MLKRHVLRITLVTATLLAGVPALAAAQGTRAVAARVGGATATPPAYGARVQIVSPRLGAGWHTGVMGRVGACPAVMIAREGGDEPAFSAIPFVDIERLRVSSRYDGQPDRSGRRREYRPGLDTSGERWIDVAVRPLRRECTPF